MSELVSTQAIIQQYEQNEQVKLNFENEESVEQRELAHQDLTAAKTLANASKNTDSKNKNIKKALNRKAKQTAMEATEHAQKAVILADDKHKFIADSQLHGKLEKTHNNKFMQREQKKAQINILTFEDIVQLNSAVRQKNGEKSPYNAVRYTDQEIDDENVDKAIEVAQKAVDNLDDKVRESKKSVIEFDNCKVSIDI